MRRRAKGESRRVNNWETDPVVPFGQHTFVVSKPFCTPSRVILTRAFEGLNFKNFRISRDWFPPAEVLNPLSIKSGIRQYAKVRVNKQAAKWAEYVIASTGVFKMESGGISRANWNKGASRQGVPMPWALQYQVQDGEAEEGCSISELPEEYQEFYRKAEKDGGTDVIPASEAYWKWTSERTRKPTGGLVGGSGGSGRRGRKKRKRGGYRGRRRRS